MATRTPPGISEGRLHAVVIAVAGVLAIVMVGAAVWAVTRPQPPGTLPQPPATAPGEDTQTAAVSTGSAGLATTGSSTPPPVVPGESTVATTSGPSVSTAGADRRIAFHIGDTLYIASEDGKTKTPMHIVGTNYALSPDGLTVAAIEKGKLVVAAVGQHLLASSPSTPSLTSEAIAPVWLPDSSAVLFIRASTEGLARIWRFERSSGVAREVGPGSGIAVSPNGRTIAAMPTEDSATSEISVMTGSTKKTFSVTQGDPVALTLGRDRVYVSTVSTSGASALWSYTYDGTKRRQLVGSGVAGSTSVTYGELMVSPDGKRLLFAADGDDGYSRLWTVPTAGGTPTAISGLRDGYAVRWTRDGKGILFVQGNAFQGQATSLWISDLTGNRRKKLVDGATL